MNIFSNESFMSAFLLMVVCIAAGYFMRRKNIISSAGKQTLTALIYRFTVPCLAFVSFMRDYSAQDMRTGAAVLIASLVFYALWAAAGTLIFRKNGGITAGLMCAIGQLTLFSQPLLRAMGSETAVMYCGIMALSFRFMVYGVSSALITGRRSAKAALLNPIVPAMLLGLFVWLAQDSLPFAGYLRFDRTIPPVYRVLSSLSDLVCPLGMLLIGANIGESAFRVTLSDGTAWLVSAVRCIACPLSVLIVTRLMSGVFDPDAVTALTIGFAAPASLTLSAFCTAAGHDEEFSGHIVVLSTLLSVAALPVLGALI